MDIDKVIIRANFKKNLFKEIDRYNEIDEELGKRFFEQVDRCINYIELNPLLFQKRYREIRVCFTKVFPFGIYYIVKETPSFKKKRIYILNILHTSKRVRYKS